jgi:hypothetical protein
MTALRFGTDTDCLLLSGEKVDCFGRRQDHRQ